MMVRKGLEPSGMIEFGGLFQLARHRFEKLRH